MDRRLQKQRCFRDVNLGKRGGEPYIAIHDRIFSDRPYYMLQCDFGYMIGPGMFDEFVKPELTASIRRLPRSFYHLDGKGQLPHLDSLLSIPELTGVQWQPGDGVPECEYWPELFTRIFAAGKKTQMVRMTGNPALIHQLLGKTGLGPGTYLCQSLSGTVADKPEIERILRSFGVPG